MKRTTYFGVICTLVITSISITAVGDNITDVYLDYGVQSGYARLGTAAIPCVPEELRFSCSNKSPHRSLEVIDIKCFVGAGDDPKVLPLDNFHSEVAPETTEVVPVSCDAGPVFCTARVHPRRNARCALTSRTRGLNAELR